MTYCIQLLLLETLNWCSGEFSHCLYNKCFCNFATFLWNLLPSAASLLSSSTNTKYLCASPLSFSLCHDGINTWIEIEKKTFIRQYYSIEKCNSYFVSLCADWYFSMILIFIWYLIRDVMGALNIEVQSSPFKGIRKSSTLRKMVLISYFFFSSKVQLLSRQNIPLKIRDIYKKSNNFSCIVFYITCAKFFILSLNNIRK